MPFRTWVYVFAITGLTGFSALGQTEEQAEGQQGQADQQEQPAYKPPLPFPVEIIEDQASADARKTREAEARDREIADLVAQEGMNAATQSIEQATSDMRDYTLYSTIAVCIGTILLLLTLRLTSKANNAANRAVSITEKIGKDQSRAYVHVKSIDVRTEYVQGSDSAECVFFVENSGSTPCKRFEVIGGAEYISSQSDASELPTFDGNASASNALPGHGGFEFGRVFNVAEKAKKSADYNLHIGGVVRYVTFFDEVFETEFSFVRKMSPLEVKEETSDKVRMSRSELELRTYEEKRANTLITPHTPLGAFDT